MCTHTHNPTCVGPVTLAALSLLPNTHHSLHRVTQGNRPLSLKSTQPSRPAHRAPAWGPHPLLRPRGKMLFWSICWGCLPSTDQHYSVRLNGRQVAGGTFTTSPSLFESSSERRIFALMLKHYCPWILAPRLTLGNSSSGSVSRMKVASIWTWLFPSYVLPEFSHLNFSWQWSPVTEDIISEGCCCEFGHSCMCVWGGGYVCLCEESRKINIFSFRLLSASATSTLVQPAADHALASSHCSINF